MATQDLLAIYSSSVQVLRAIKAPTLAQRWETWNKQGRNNVLAIKWGKRAERPRLGSHVGPSSKVLPIVSLHSKPRCQKQRRVERVGVRRLYVRKAYIRDLRQVGITD